VHPDATLLLSDLLEATGLVTFVGKVNMDRNCPPYICEESAAASIAATEAWLEKCAAYKNTRPILTPRFIPACSDELMAGLGGLQKKYALPVQSHLSENKKEIAFVRSLCPAAKNYGDAYLQSGLFGGEVPTIMAHCVWSDDEEVALMQERGVFLALCPENNWNICSGAAPIKRYIEQGLHVGLGSDVAGGAALSIFKAAQYAILSSKMRRMSAEQNEGAVPEALLTVNEAFYLATKGGGAFFGKVGSFEEGYEFDAVVVNDTPLLPPYKLSLQERLERVIYLSDDRHIAAKFVRAKAVLGAEGK
jgi:guanine deaminase